MFRSYMIAAAMAASVAMPGHAATSMPTSPCDDASMKVMQSRIDSISDAAEKKAATDEMTLAKASVKADKIKDCSLHIDNAMKAIGGTK